MDEVKQPVAIFNGPICTTDGLYWVSEITPKEAQDLIRTYGFVSAVGHEASAEVLSAVLETEIPMNRIQFIQSVGQKAVALMLNIRPPEGTVLSTAEMLDVGFTLKLMERLE
jgi:hypothetical protein